MALVTINNVGIISGTIWLPLRGVWSADLVIDQPDGTGFDAGTSVTIQAPDLTLVGVVAPNRTGDFLDAVHVRVLGGAGGMAKTASPQAFTQPGAFVRDVVNGILGDGGEKVSTTTDASFLATNLTAWAVKKQLVSQALEQLISIIAPTFNWRVLTDGTVWIGVESWPTATVTNTDTLKQNPADGSFDLGVEAPAIVPGTNIDGIGHIGRVEHHIEGGRIRTFVWQDFDSTERGMKAAVASMVKQATGKIDFFTRYQCKVIKQSGDYSTVDVQPTDQTLPGMSNVPVMWGIPGVTAQVSPGDFIMVGWDGGDPSKPYACDWQPNATTLQLNITATTIDIKANGNSTIEATGNTTVKGVNVSVTATGTATVAGNTSTKLGNVGTLPVLVQGTVDSMGVPVTQNPAASATTVLAG